MCASEVINYGGLEIMVLDEYKDNKLSAVVLQKHYRLASYSSLNLVSLFPNYLELRDYFVPRLVPFRSSTHRDTCE